jgi:hypothetical protein
MTTINNVAYSWSMIQLKSSITGDTGGETGLLIDATAVEYETKRKHDWIYGLGGQPRKRGFGNITYSASIELPYGTQLMLREKSPNGTLLGLGNFDLVLSWCNDLSDEISSETITLKECLLVESCMDAKQDDTSLTRKFDLNPRRIYNPTALSSATWSYEFYGKN